MSKVFAKHLPCSHCSKEGKTVAKGLCNACYYRLKKNGTLEYKVRKKPIECCIVEGCNKPVVSKEYCDTHHTNNKRFGDPIRNFGYGERSEHQLYECWAYQKRTNEGRVPEWNDFWCFVNDVGERPTEKHHARRYDFKKPWGPANFYWQEKAASGISKKEYQREWRKKNTIKSKNTVLKRAYGIDMLEYMRMYERQKGGCAICGEVKESFSTDKGRNSTLVVDHCHEQGHIRELLCAKCNKGLGHFNDDIALMEKAIEYVKKHRKQ